MKKYVKIIKILAIILTLTLTSQVTTFAQVSDPDKAVLGDIQLEGQGTQEDIAIIEEDTTKRGEYEKHFLKEDGSFLAVTYAQPVNYEKDGAWQEIDNTLIESVNDSGEKVLTNKDGLMDVSFKQSPSEDFVTVEKDNYSVSFSVLAKTESKIIEPAVKFDAKNPMADIFAPGLNTDAKIKEDSLAPILDTENQVKVDVLEPELNVKAKVKAFDFSDLDLEDRKTVAEKASSKLEYADVFKNVNLEYIVGPEQVKENIVLDSPSNITEYKTVLSLDGLTPELQDDNSVSLLNGKGEAVFMMPAPYMFDSSEKYSYNINVTLAKTETGEYEITYIPDSLWLSSSERKYPVTIDPTVSVANSSSDVLDTCTHTGDGSCNHHTATTIYSGLTDCGSMTARIHRTYIRFKTLPTIADKYIIDAATLVLTGAGSMEQKLQAFRVTSNWTNPLRATAEPDKADACITGVQSGREYEFNVTEVVQNWYLGKNGNYGWMIANASGGSKAISSSDNTDGSVKPRLYVGYGDYGGGSLATGIYYIKNQWQGKYLDVPGGSAGDGVALQTYALNRTLAQQWYVEKQSDGTYKIYSMRNKGYGLDVYKGDDINETKLQLWSKNYNKQSKFRIWAINGSICKIMPCSTYTKSLDVYQGSDSSLYGKKVQIFNSGNGTNQQWVFEKVTRITYYGNSINNGYERETARNYAEKYAEYADNSYDTPDFLLTGSGQECTNFVSACLLKGGMPERGSIYNREADEAWYYGFVFSKYLASFTWGGADVFNRHWGHDFYGNGLQRSYITYVYSTTELALKDWDYIYSNLKVGDVIQTFKIFNNYSTNHSMIIHKKDNNEIYYAQHTGSPRKNASLKEYLERENIASPNYGVIFHAISMY